MGPSRRELVAGAAALASCGKLVWDSALPVPPELAELVAALEEARTGRKAVKAAGDHLASGGTVAELERALLVACVRQLPFEQLGFAAHPLWTVASAREAGRRGSRADAVVAALHAVDLFKRSQRDSRGDRLEPGALGPLPAADPVALDEAIGATDADGAQEIATALLRAGDLEGLVEGLRRGALRNLGSIGHVQIHVAQVVRAMDEVGWDEAVVRVLAWGLAHEGAQDWAVPAPHEANVGRAAALPAGWDAGADDPGAAVALLAEVRTTDPDQAAEAVAGALVGGVGLGSVWDALVIRGAELSLGHRDLEGVFPGFHTLTGLEAMRWIAETTADDETRRRAVLQAASLVAVNDADARGRSAGDEDPVRLDTLEPVGGASAAAVLDRASTDRVGAAARLLGLAERDGIAGFVGAQRALALRAADDDHHLKLPVAAWLLAEAAAPELAGHVLAGTLGFGNTAADRDWELLELARELAAS